MSSYKNSLLITTIIALFMLCACGQKVTEPVPPIVTTTGPVDHKADLVLLPLTDYSNGDTVDSPLHRQVKVREALTYRLIQHGYYLPVLEDVTQYLTEHNITIESPNANIKDGARQSLEREMASGWSAKMQDKINSIVSTNDQANNYASGKYSWRGLSPGVLKGIGHHFDVDYVLRGRIIESRISDNENAVFELALALQEVNSGKIVWANRAREEVSREYSVFDEQDERNQMDLAIEAAADKLVADLANTLEKLPVHNNSYSRETEVAQNPIPKTPPCNSAPMMEEPASKHGVKETNPANWGS